MIIFLSISVVLITLALVAVVITWSVKCILEWLDDIKYWWKEFRRNSFKPK